MTPDLTPAECGRLHAEEALADAAAAMARRKQAAAAEAATDGARDYLNAFATRAEEIGKKLTHAAQQRIGGR
jgi:hypothetical protein